ncbi:protein kinase subdomain-containing protein PKL/CAK/ChoK [Crepidotus variabilis]|uniref:Protein kinase subdomain-containing protein PKL/CAK/ChoK n=1 Tax=Crepidotus variabilis TaxID=179855 RepID=A0A9P6JWD3_9AGAR|nr:protein kinase subdomain-containing protein PKL/CAK/ChoK [Crepidotus variabilis]
MTPVLSQSFSSSSASITNPTAPSLTRELSNSSIQSLADLLISSSTSQLAEASGQEVVREEGLRHAKVKLDARHYKKSTFTLQLLEIVHKLRIPVWSTASPSADDIIIQRVSGALTNAVFFVSCPTLPFARTLLLRVYGSSSGSLISRTRELHILHVLSSVYKIGPRVYGTFENGRIEEYFDSVTLTASDIRDPQISRWIGARMAELHSVDVDVVDSSPEVPGGVEIVTNVKSWLKFAKKVLKLPGISGDIRHELDLGRFRKEWEAYVTWALKRQHTLGTKRVFAHNDAQYGNLLRLKNDIEGVDEHRQIIVVDFEYAAPNPAAFDIANHFHEWTANYHSSTPHILTPALYPSLEERRNFYSSYIRHSSMLAEDPSFDEDALDGVIDELDRDVKIWGAASHAGWAIWGIIQAREDLEAELEQPEFDYIGYARGRMAAFRKALQDLDISM